MHSAADTEEGRPSSEKEKGTVFEQEGRDRGLLPPWLHLPLEKKVLQSEREREKIAKGAFSVGGGSLPRWVVGRSVGLLCLFAFLTLFRSVAPVDQNKIKVRPRSRHANEPLWSGFLSRCDSAAFRSLGCCNFWPFLLPGRVKSTRVIVGVEKMQLFLASGGKCRNGRPSSSFCPCLVLGR